MDRRRGREGRGACKWAPVSRREVRAHSHMVLSHILAHDSALWLVGRATTSNKERQRQAVTLEGGPGRELEAALPIHPTSPQQMDGTLKTDARAPESSG